MSRLPVKPSWEAPADLSTLRVFESLSPGEIRQLEDAASLVPYRAGKVLYSPHQPGESVFIVRDGRIQLYRMSSEGRKLVIRTSKPGAIFGESVLFGQRTYDAFAEIVQDSLLYVVDRRHIHRLILANPRLAIGLLDWIGTRLQETEERFEHTVFSEVPSRLAALLLRLGEEAHSDEVAVTHEELAELLGVYRETVSTVLGQFRRQGLLSTGRGSIRLIDPAGLDARVGG